MTVWATVEWIPNYWFTEEGEVWSAFAAGSRHNAGEPIVRLRPSTCPSTGYKVANLTVLGRPKRFFVHRLMLESHVGPCPRGMEACHNNGVRTDNRIDNLRWDTRKNNHADKWIHGTQQAGEQCGTHVLTNADVLEIKRRIVGGDTNKSLSAKFSVDKTTISAIRSGRIWGWLKCEGFSPHSKAAMHELNGQKRSVRGWARFYGVPEGRVRSRMRRGASLLDALETPFQRGIKVALQAEKHRAILPQQQRRELSRRP